MASANVVVLKHGANRGEKKLEANYPRTWPFDEEHFFTAVLFSLAHKVAEQKSKKFQPLK